MPPTCWPLLKVWDDVEEYERASEVYGAVSDALHGIFSVSLPNGTIVRALEVSSPQELTDPNDAWVQVFGFFQVMCVPLPVTA